MRIPVTASVAPGHAAERAAEHGGVAQKETSCHAPAQSGRRDVLVGAGLAAAGVCPPCARDAAAQGGASQQGQAPRMARPAAGDLLVFAAGEKAGKPVGVEDLAVGGPQVLAWAMEPGSGVVRSGSRLNQVVVVRLDPAALDEDTSARSAGGVVAYSAVCTHAQCSVSEWRREKSVLHCPCHQSEFDPKQGGKVVGGPAQRPLAALPVKVADGVKIAEGADAADGVLVVAKPFVGRVGAPSS